MKECWSKFSFVENWHSLLRFNVSHIVKTPENHTSLEILFDMSGKGEDLQPTILTNEGYNEIFCFKYCILENDFSRFQILCVFPDIKSRQTFINQTKPEESFLPADAWTDDEMFTDESLIGAMDNLQKIATPAVCTLKSILLACTLNKKTNIWYVIIF